MAQYHLKNNEDYVSNYKESIDNPSKFWETIAKENFIWREKWNSVLEYDLSFPKVEWFKGAKLNITENCIDRHLEKKADQNAFIWVPNDPNKEVEEITYGDLKKRVGKMANLLLTNGIKKGDKVCIYLPMIPELAIAVLACARIGAIHSVVFAGFSSKALASRINDSECKMVITSDGSYRGNKTLDLKGIVDDALDNCPSVKTVLVKKYIESKIHLRQGRDLWLDEELAKESSFSDPEIMDAEDPLFILYTSGSTGKPKGMLHTTAGYMVYTAYSFKNVFQYEDNDVYWCTADIGWITGHSYMVYGPLLNGATSVIFEGVPTYPDAGRFWEICEKLKVNQFYTAPTAIRALAKYSTDFVNKYDLSALKVIGSVGEPINQEAWDWYNDFVGKHNATIVDTWWQTETGGIMISNIPRVTPQKATFSTLPLPGIQPELLNKEGKPVTKAGEEGMLAFKHPWPSMARTVYGDHERYKKVYFSAFENKYFSGDGAFKDEEGNFRITGRVDDVIIVSGHNLGTAPIENVINNHEMVSESAIVGFPHDVKGRALYGFVILKDKVEDLEATKKEVNNLISGSIGPIAKLDKIQFVPELPKTRSGKIMRRILRKIASEETEHIGDISTLLNPEIVEHIINGKAF